MSARAAGRRHRERRAPLRNGGRAGHAQQRRAGDAPLVGHPADARKSTREGRVPGPEPLPPIHGLGQRITLAARPTLVCSDCCEPQT
eukprot:4651249-Lingulodinium_polyedra.AAC.1